MEMLLKPKSKVRISNVDWFWKRICREYGIEDSRDNGRAALPSPEGHVCSRADCLDAHMCTSGRLVQRAPAKQQKLQQPGKWTGTQGNRRHMERKPTKNRED